MTETTDPEFWNREQTAGYLVTTIRTLENWAMAGYGPAYYRIGKRALYKPTEVREWAEAQRVQLVQR